MLPICSTSMMIMMRLIFVLLALASGVLAAQTNEVGLQFLAEKEAEEGVVKLPSGLLYKELVAGYGPRPFEETKTTCHYEMKLPNGKVIDSSYDRKLTDILAPNETPVKGWTEALQLMKEGAMWELYVPANLAYGDAGIGHLVPPGSALCIKVELISVMLDYDEDDNDDDL